MKILVTGSAGFIGYHVCSELLERGYQVIGVDNFNDYYDVKLKERRNQLLEKYPAYRLYKLNIADAEALRQVFEQEPIQLVVHLAAQAGVRYSIEQPGTYVQSNLVGFANILEACREFSIRRLLYASSSSVYGDNQEMPFTTEQRVDYPVSFYAATKKANELMAHSYSHLYGIQTIGLRFFTVYGPWGRPDMAPFIFADAIRNDRAIKLYNQGNHLRDFTYIDDVVLGMMRIIESSALPKQYSVYNIGCSNPVHLLEFVNQFELAFGKKAIKEYAPMQPGDVYATYADVTPLQRDFDYRPRTNIETGVRSFVEWFKAYYNEEAVA